MALEKWTVFYEVRDAGGHGPANWKQGEIIAQGKNKSQGYLFEEKSGLITGEPEECKFVTVEAESAEEAAQAIRAFYGQGINYTVGLAAKPANLTEVKFQS